MADEKKHMPERKPLSRRRPNDNIDLTVTVIGIVSFIYFLNIGEHGTSTQDVILKSLAKSFLLMLCSSFLLKCARYCMNIENEDSFPDEKSPQFPRSPKSPSSSV